MMRFYQAIVLADVVDDKCKSGVLLQVDSWKGEFCDRVDLVDSLCKRCRVRAFLCHVLLIMSLSARQYSTSPVVSVKRKGTTYMVLWHFPGDLVVVCDGLISHYYVPEELRESLRASVTGIEEVTMQL